MPRLAATLASLLLIASSIGVNIARYPSVGRPLDPPSAGTVEAASPPQTASTAPAAEKADIDQSPGKPNTPATREARPNVANNDLPSDRMVAVAPLPPAAQTDGNVPIVDVRPMVSGGDTQANVTETSMNRSRVQRLPAVDSGSQFQLEADSAVDGKGYSTTSTP